MENFEDLHSFIATYKQEHLLKYWDSLNNDERNELTRNLKEIDFESVITGFKKAIQTPIENKLSDNYIKPVPKSLYKDVNSAPADELQCYENLAWEIIAESKLAVLVLAGGQGSRLGVSYPKGMYDVGLTSHKSLFQIQAERILRLEELSLKNVDKEGCITWLIMTSRSTTKPTEKFFKDHNYFGLCEENVIFFEQSVLPAFSMDGKIMLADRSKVVMSPNGNGGIYEGLRSNKIIELLEERGVEYVHAFSVDNILCRVGDPQLLGFCVDSNSDCGVKVVEKTNPQEPIGVVCLIHGEWRVVEYSEISPDIAAKRTNDGRLLLNAGSICDHMFRIDFLRDCAQSHEQDMEFHIARKKIETIDEHGNKVKPKTPNGIKLEKFIFDVFPFAHKLVVWNVNRDEEFSPLKNSNDAGIDCPATARRDMYSLHRKWIVKNGGKLETTAVECEISPLVSYAGEDLQELVQGKTFSSPCHLEADKA